MVEIYALDISLLPEEGQEEYDQMCVMLSKERQERIQKCKQSEKRKQILGAGILLDRVLKRNGIRMDAVQKNKHGKPEVSGICFNLSHSGNVVLCAVSAMPVGCDVERIQSVSKDLAERFFCESEKAYLKNYEGYSYEREFCRLWTAKESYVKMTGEGFHLHPDQFEVRPEMPILVYQDGQRQECYFKEYELPGYCITVCAREKDFSEIHWEE